ncbi:MAG: hypothetical protein ABJA77_00445 [Variovorax sp.]
MTSNLPLPTRRRMCSRLVIAVAAPGWIASGWAQAQATGRTEALYEGVLGTSLIGMTLVAPRGADGRLTGHYFYGKFLKDIPLTGSFQGGRLTLREASGGTFTLDLVGNGTGGGKPLDFSNSIGLTGVWTQGGKRLDVTLGNTANRQAGGRRYEQVTKETDEEFEVRVQGFHRAVLAGDRAEAARFVDFPLRVNQGGKGREIASAEQLHAAWDQVFTRACLNALKEALPHDMFVSNGRAMIGNGVAWFSANGAVAINVP